MSTGYQIIEQGKFQSCGLFGKMHYKAEPTPNEDVAKPWPNEAVKNILPVPITEIDKHLNKST